MRITQLEAAVVGFRHQPAEIQSQSYTTAVAATIGIGAEEGLCHLVQLLLWHTMTMIAHLDVQALITLTNMQLDRGLGAAMPQGIVEQVAQQQAHAGPVQLQRR